MLKAPRSFPQEIKNTRFSLWFCPQFTSATAFSHKTLCTHYYLPKHGSFWYQGATNGLTRSHKEPPTTTTTLRPFFRDHPGEPVPEENFWTLWCKGRLTEADTPTIRLGATPSRLTTAHLQHPPIFYRPDALPAAQPTVSKHRRQQAHLD